MVTDVQDRCKYCNVENIEVHPHLRWPRSRPTDIVSRWMTDRTRPLEARCQSGPGDYATDSGTPPTRNETESGDNGGRSKSRANTSTKFTGRVPRLVRYTAYTNHEAYLKITFQMVWTLHSCSPNITRWLWVVFTCEFIECNPFHSWTQQLLILSLDKCWRHLRQWKVMARRSSAHRGWKMFEYSANRCGTFHGGEGMIPSHWNHRSLWMGGKQLASSINDIPESQDL